jgi:hypothetical protein
MVLRILWRIDLFLGILSWKALLSINITSSFWPSAIDIQFSLISRHLLCPGLLKNKWDIPSSFVFPLTDIRGTKRRFNRSWLEKYKWLRYSESENGVFSLCCVLFNSSKTNDDGISHLFFSKNNFCWSSTFDLSKARSKLFGWIYLNHRQLFLVIFFYLDTIYTTRSFWWKIIKINFRIPAC